MVTARRRAAMEHEDESHPEKPYARVTSSAGDGTESEPIDPEALRRATQLLERLAADRALLAPLPAAERRALLTAAGRLARPDPADKRRLSKALRKQDRAERRREDERALDRAEIRSLRRAPIYPTPPLLPPEATRPSEATSASADPLDGAAPPPLADAAAPRPELSTPRSCYICKADYRRVHFFYDSMCERCGDLNFRKRNQSCSLVGRTALITGARVKIGYHAAIKLLRAGARVLATTRFPQDAAERFAREPDFALWSDRLSVHGLDLRHTPSVEAFAQQLLRSLDRLDFIVNNACQTVRRPPGFYAHLMEGERRPPGALSTAVRRLLDAGSAGGSDAHDAAALSQLALVPEDARPEAGLFPAGRLDQDLQQVDLRDMNSWRLRLGEVSTVELLEVQLVNSVAPFVLNGKLRTLMARDRSFDKHVVNVSAMEGQFYRSFKTDKHPHTNMAKAALNMMTRTSAPDYARDGIYMNSVDTGWITDEDPAAIAERKAAEQGAAFQPPLDVVDGAARILDPIFDGFISGQHRFGLFFKDYAPTPW